MIAKNKSKHKIPVICYSQSSVPSISLFNANDWTGDSRSVIRSCATQYSLILHESSGLKQLFDNAGELCSNSLRNLQRNWETSPWDLDSCSYLVEVPEVHLHIEAFFSSVKTFLDLLVQIISAENIVKEGIHAFHRKRSQIGGRVLHTLSNNASPDRKSTALELINLINDHKTLWIDQVVNRRDNLLHPNKAKFQVMFQLDLSSHYGKLNLERILKPGIDGEDFDQYAQRVVAHIKEFSRLLIDIIKKA